MKTKNRNSVYSGGILLAPSGQIMETRPGFHWTPVVDAQSGVVSYTLQLDSSDSSAVSLQAGSTVITTTQLSYTPTVDLPGGVYTWTVRAYDMAGNASDWFDPPQTFTIAADSEKRYYLPIVIKGGNVSSSSISPPRSGTPSQIYLPIMVR